ncbi:hypothetical protein FOH10_18910 [Nocardia otitidiscaviarum]|uniref:Uncharacterized protein n=1 Tax=Nocardia otitidiscaviarum TaxID=1823 RepID=A0A516NNJ3_9NOCA|nr:hypothetical protein [Nocardia otitidiscaviarum]MCP9624292.1 ATP-binding protein [Nocardia otitidiscaviarum]QDP80473.1 hypothetical protein FOH10_18910 [Nocardia otitidiscaviarum]
MEPSKGEVSALVGFGGQFELAARIVIAKLATLEWIRVADLHAGIADDFQFKSAGRRHALQVKWSQVPGTFSWSDLTAGKKAKGDLPAKPGLFTQLSLAWRRLRAASPDPLTIYLCSNNIASDGPAPAGSPLDRAGAPKPRSLARFVIHSFTPAREAIDAGCTRWSDLAVLPAVADWASVWDALRELAPLTDEEFVGFIQALELRFGIQTTDPLLLPDQDCADGDVEHLSATLQKIVRDPVRPEQLSREDLLARLGWTDRLAYRHPHQFPIPEVYTANNAARTALEQRLNEPDGGYLALIGPAGSGKSTLLASLKLSGRVVHYYAFVPDSPNPLSSRGEAESYLHDVSLALEANGLPRRGIGNDLRSRRAVMLDQLDQAGRHWSERGERTIVIVDGLDHVPREQNPTRSFIEELPAPTALPAGVFVVLGTQSVAMLGAEVRAVLQQHNRTVVLPPLSSQESERVVELSGVGSWMYPGQIQKAAEAGEGHPLALTYLLQELTALQERVADLQARRESASRLLVEAAGYGRDIEARYRGYFRAVASDPQVRNLLGMVARLRVPVNLAWLATWADPHIVSSFAEQTAAFFRRAGDDLQFIHNSFRRFLVEETARVGDRFDQNIDQHFHRQLAEICARANDEWRLYGEEEIAHRYLANQHDHVLALASPVRLLQSLVNLRPLETVRDHALLAVRSAATVDNSPTLVSVLIFLNELWGREYVLETADLAQTLLLCDRRIALEHVVRANSLRVEPHDAMHLAVEFATAGDFDAARQIVHACGGLPGLLDSSHRSDTVFSDWARVTWLLSGTDAVLAELDYHLPPARTVPSLDADTSARDDIPPEQDDSQIDHAFHRNVVHTVCFDRVIENRDDSELDRLTGLIDAEAGPSWRARARLARARAASDDQMPARVLELVLEIIAINTESDAEEEEDKDLADGTSNHAVALSIRVASAELLARHGFTERPEIDQLVPPGTTPAWPSGTDRREGLAPFATWIAFHRLRQVKRDPALEALAVSENPMSSDPYRKRLRRALRTLAELEGQQLTAELGLNEPPPVAALARIIIRLREIPSSHSHSSMTWGRLSSIARDLHVRIIDLAVKAGGGDGLMRLLEQFDTAWTDPHRSRYWPPEQRQTIITAAVNAHPLARLWALERLEQLDADIDTLHDEPYGRANRYLSQAQAWAAAQKPDAARRCVQLGVRASMSIGASDHDQQLIEWIDWLAAANAAGQLSPTHFDTAARRYAARLAAAAPVATNQAWSAAEQLTELVFAHNPALGCTIAEWLCNAGVFSETAMIQSIVLAACGHPDIPITDAVTVAAHLLYPIALEPPSRIEKAVRLRDAPDGSALTTLRNAQAACPLPMPEHQPAPTSHSTRSPSSPQIAFADNTRIDTIGALLARLRNAASIADAPLGGWDETVQRLASIGPVPQPMARALIESATRVGLSGPALGGLIALAARSGEVATATAVLTDELSRTRGSGWLRHGDGGSRLTLLGAALSDRHPALVRLARHDFTNSLATGSLAGNLSPDDIRRIITVIAGADTIAAAWPQIETHLDEIIATGSDPADSIPNPTSATTTNPVAVLAQWVTQHLGHPIRPLDFGARRALQLLHSRHPDSIQQILAEAIDNGGWRCEAALLALITTPPDERVTELSVTLIAALRTTAVGADGICRELAARVGNLYRVGTPDPEPRTLPVGYELVLPTLPSRTLPELDRRGVPHLDPHDPQQLLAPFDEPLKLLADLSSLSASAVMHHASRLTDSGGDRWIAHGHQGQADLLNKRRQLLGYRPWAYMAGRRALGTVLADLADAGLLDSIPFPRTYRLGLVDERLAGIEPTPIPGTMPPPWWPDTAPTYDFRDWCSETQQALARYTDAYTDSTPYILAEYGRWRILDWSLPEENRFLHAHHGSSDGPLLLPTLHPWEESYDGAQRYPLLHDLEWTDEEFVVHGYETFSDAVHMTWLALHPAVGARLGWRHDDQKLFTWNGTDGQWRARSVLLVQGELTHQPRSDAICTETWQVQLSNAGYTDIVAEWPSLRRELRITRRLPANGRQGHPAERVSTFRTILGAPQPSDATTSETTDNGQ